MDTDEDSFVASRASLQSRRERLARRTGQNALEAQHSVGPTAELDAEAAALSSLVDELADGGGQASRARRHSADTRSAAGQDGAGGSASASRADGGVGAGGRVCREREYVQPRIVDQCDDVALSLIQSSSILSMEEQGSHPRCGRTLSGEGNTASLRRTMPARMRASLGGDRDLLDGTSAAESQPSQMVRQASVDSIATISNGGIGRGGVTAFRRQSSIGNGATGLTESQSPLGWTPGNSGLTSRPALAVASDDLCSDRERRPAEQMQSDESREERIARYKAQRRRSKQASPVASLLGGDERETSGPAQDSDVVHKRCRSLDDSWQQQQQLQDGLRRGSSVFFDPTRQTSEDSAQPPSTSSSVSDPCFDFPLAGTKPDVEASTAAPASELLLPARPASLKLDAQHSRARALESAAATRALPTSSISTSVGDGQPLQPVATPEGKSPDLPGLANARRNSRRRRSNMHLDVDQSDITPTLHEVPAEAEAADASLASVSVVTRPRRRRPTDKCDSMDTTPRDTPNRDISHPPSQHPPTQLMPNGTAAAQDYTGKEGSKHEWHHSSSLNEAGAKGQQLHTEASRSEEFLGEPLSNGAANVENEEPLEKPSSALGVTATAGNSEASDHSSALVAGCSTQVASVAEHRVQNRSQLTESKLADYQTGEGKSWHTGEKDSMVPSAASTPNWLDHKPAVHSDKTASPMSAGNNAKTLMDAKTSSSCTPDAAVSGADGARVITQTKTLSEKKAAALGLILQKFEAASSGLPPAIAAAIGLPSPTSVTTPSQKQVPTAKTVKVENVIKQISGHQQEPNGGTHQPDKAQMHKSASVESLARRFSGTPGSPPAPLHTSHHMSSIDGTCADAAAAGKSSSPVGSASLPSLADASATGAQRSSSDRAASPNNAGSGHPAASTLSSRSSPGIQRRSPVTVSSPTSPHGKHIIDGGDDAFRLTDSDASSQLTDDGQHSDTAGRHRPIVPVIKQQLQSPTKLQSQQHYFSKTGKKSSRTASSPIAAVTASTQECATESGSAAFDQLQGGNREEEEQHADESCHKKEAVSEAPSSLVLASEPWPGRPSSCSSPDPCDRTNPDQHHHGANADARVHAPGDSNSLDVCVAADSSSTGASSVTEPERLPPATQDDSDRDTPKQPQPFAKLRAMPAAAKSAAAKNEPSPPSPPQLDPQLANILQARLKKADSKPTLAARLGMSLPSTQHAERKQLASKEEAVDRATQSIKDKALYFMQMQQKLVSAGTADSAAPAARTASSGSSVGVRSRPPPPPVSAKPRMIGINFEENDSHTGQVVIVAEQPSELAETATAPPPTEQAVPAQQQRKGRHRMRNRRRGSLSGSEPNRWQTQPVTDNEVLVVAAAVAVRAQAMAGDGGDCPWPPKSSAIDAAGAAQSGVAADEVRRLAVMTLEEKIGLFMDRSVAWTCRDSEFTVSPDRSMRHLAIDQRAVASRCRRAAAWRGRFSTQPVSPADLQSVLNTLGSSVLAPPAALDADFNQKIADLCHEIETRRLAATEPPVAPEGGECNEQKPGSKEQVSASGQCSGKGKVSIKAEAVASSPHGLSDARQRHINSAKEVGGGAVGKRGQRTSTSSPAGAKKRPNSVRAEPSDSADNPGLNGKEMTKNATPRKSGIALKTRTKIAEKPAKNLPPVSMHGSAKMHEEVVAGSVTRSPVSAGPSHSPGSGSKLESKVTARPHSAKTSFTALHKTKDSVDARTHAAASRRGDRVSDRSSTSRGDEDGRPETSPTTATAVAHKEQQRASDARLKKGRDTHAREQDTQITESLTWADKSKSQPCISTMDDSSADNDLQSFIRATTSYAHKLDHLVAESGEGDGEDNRPDIDDRSSLDGSRRETSHGLPLQGDAAELNSNRASVRRVHGPRASTGAHLESPVSHQNGGEPSYMRATKAMSMRDIRSPGAKAPRGTEESAAIGTRTKPRSMDGSRNSLPARLSSVTMIHSSPPNPSSSDDEDDDDSSDLPSYMRATKSFAHKVDHLIESCDEEEGEDETAAAARQDECSDGGEHGSSARSPTARHSRTPSTHGGFELTPRDHTMQEGKQIENEGGRERRQAQKLGSHSGETSNSGSSAGLHQESTKRPVSTSQGSPVAMPNKAHLGGKSRSSASQVPVVDGKRRKAAAVSGLDKVDAEAGGGHITKVDAEPGKIQRRSKDKHVLIGGDVPLFMKATKSSLTKDRQLVSTTELGQRHFDDQDKTTRVHAQRLGKKLTPPQHHRGQDSGESLCSVGAASSKAESGHLSSSDAVDHGHAPFSPITMADSGTAKPGKLPPTKISDRGGMTAQHSRPKFGAVGGSAG